MKNVQNELLNAAKGLACICVVFMHCEFPGTLGVIVQTITRFCVPFFFMVSGYYCYYSSGITPDGKMKEKLKHIAVITFNSTLFYLIAAYLSGKQMQMSYSGWVNWAIFNSPCIIVGQLWFLFALLYDYILYFFVNKFRIHRLALFLIPIAFFAYFFLAQGLHVADVHVPNMYYRNWLIEGFAFFMTGYWIRKNNDKLHFRNDVLIAIIVISTIMCIPERYIFGRDFGVNICSVPQVLALFLLAVNNPTEQETKMSILGKRYSMYVYILHPFIWNVIKLTYSKMNLNGSIICGFAMPILVVLATLAFSHVVYIYNKKMKLITSRNA